jgi:hypothetical protein
MAKKIRSGDGVDGGLRRGRGFGGGDGDGDDKGKGEKECEREFHRETYRWREVVSVSERSLACAGITGQQRTELDEHDYS